MSKFIAWGKTVTPKALTDHYEQATREEFKAMMAKPVIDCNTFLEPVFGTQEMPFCSYEPKGKRRTRHNPVGTYCGEVAKYRVHWKVDGKEVSLWVCEKHYQRIKRLVKVFVKRGGQNGSKSC